MFCSSLLVYYFRSMNKAHQHMIDMLKDQLILVNMILFYRFHEHFGPFGTF